MKVHLQYGCDGMDVEIPLERVRVIEPAFVPGLDDEAGAFLEAVRHPIGGKPLRECVAAHERVAIVVPDTTRPLPTARLLPWALAEIAHMPAENVVILNGTGSHRANTPDELRTMVGADIMARYRVINHDAQDAATLAPAGRTADGRPVAMARIMSGPTGASPSASSTRTSWRGSPAGTRAFSPPSPTSHRSCTTTGRRPSATPGAVRWNGALLPVDFLVNVTLNRRREITGFYCREVMAAHAAGCAFPIVVTTNAGYPLDQNLYQAVKGMHAAMQVVEQDGLIPAAARCNDGFPAHGNFRRLLFGYPTPRALLDGITARRGSRSTTSGKPNCSRSSPSGRGWV